MERCQNTSWLWMRIPGGCVRRSALAIGPVGRRDATGIVLATPTAQIHDLGLQMAATVARVAGYDVTYLGCGLPSEEIVACIERTKSRALALSLVYPHRDDQLVREFARLHRLLPPGVTIAVGGQAAPHYEVDLRKIRARIFTSLREFQHWLDDGLAGRSESGIARIPGRERPGEVE